MGRPDTILLARLGGDSPRIPVGVLDGSGRVADCNGGFARILDREPGAWPETLEELIAPEAPMVDLPDPGETSRIRLNLGSWQGDLHILDCIATGFEGGHLLVGEAIMMTRNQLLDRMAELTNEVASVNRELRDRIRELEEARERIRVLHGFIPICAACKKVRDDEGYWREIEGYIRDHSEADFSHGICPDCMKRLYPEDGAEDDPRV